MSDYIKREDAIQAVKDNSYSLNDDELIEVNGFGAIDSINELPSADVVKVVRCKDCKHWNKDTERNDGYGFCSYWQRFIAQAASEDIQTYKDVFCCYGERKDDE